MRVVVRVEVEISGGNGFGEFLARWTARVIKGGAWDDRRRSPDSEKVASDAEEPYDGYVIEIGLLIPR